MKKVIILSVIILAAGALCFSFNTTSDVNRQQTVNSILGDESFIKKFGYSPDAATNEDIRIITHLEYVENLLRKKNVSHLTGKDQRKRIYLLDLLHNYWKTGVFPRNYDYTMQRKPCFIDKDGRICAVGYLVEQTAGRQIAEQINSFYKYDKICDMATASVDEWIANSGLTKEECAMIQPAYGPAPTNNNPNHISPANGITSSVLGGVNLSLNTINGIQIAKGAQNKKIAIAGLISGGGQIIFGIAAMPKNRIDVEGYYTNKSLKTLCFVNIGLGASTMILSTWNLLANKKLRNKPTVWNIYGFPTADKNVGLAFSVTHKF